jgi:hypothetical protein
MTTLRSHLLVGGNAWREDSWWGAAALRQPEQFKSRAQRMELVPHHPGSYLGLLSHLEFERGPGWADGGISSGCFCVSHLVRVQLRGG